MEEFSEFSKNKNTIENQKKKKDKSQKGGKVVKK